MKCAYSTESVEVLNDNWYTSLHITNPLIMTFNVQEISFWYTNFQKISLPWTPLPHPPSARSLRSLALPPPPLLKNPGYATVQHTQHPRLPGAWFYLAFYNWMKHEYEYDSLLHVWVSEWLIGVTHGGFLFPIWHIDHSRKLL